MKSGQQFYSLYLLVKYPFGELYHIIRIYLPSKYQEYIDQVFHATVPLKYSTFWLLKVDDFVSQLKRRYFATSVCSSLASFSSSSESDCKNWPNGKYVSTTLYLLLNINAAAAIHSFLCTCVYILKILFAEFV